MVDGETLFDFLQMEMVGFLHSTKGGGGVSKNEANMKLEQMGYRVGQALIEKFSKDLPRYKDELDLMKYICKDFWMSLYSKQIDNLRTNHQGVYVLIDNDFKLLAKLTGSKQYVAEAQKYVAFPCGLVRGVLTGLGVTSFITADVTEMPLVKFQVEIQRG